MEKMKAAFSKGNVWCQADSMVIAVFALGNIDPPVLVSLELADVMIHARGAGQDGVGPDGRGGRLGDVGNHHAGLVRARGLGEHALPGAANLGVRPTLGHDKRAILEVHLLDFDRRVYGEHVTVHFLHKLRNEMKFDSLDALRVQIARDVQLTRQYFAEHAHG